MPARNAVLWYIRDTSSSRLDLFVAAKDMDHAVALWRAHYGKTYRIAMRRAKPVIMRIPRAHLWKGGDTIIQWTRLRTTAVTPERFPLPTEVTNDAHHERRQPGGAR